MDVEWWPLLTLPSVDSINGYLRVIRGFLKGTGIEYPKIFDKDDSKKTSEEKHLQKNSRVITSGWQPLEESKPACLYRKLSNAELFSERNISRGYTCDIRDASGRMESLNGPPHLCGSKRPAHDFRCQ